MNYALIFLILIIFGIVAYDWYVALAIRRAKHKLIRSYKNHYLQAISDEYQKNLTRDQALAVGQRVVDDLLNKTFEKHRFSESEKIRFRKEIEMLIKKKCPDNLFESSLIMTNEGFQRKM